MITPEDVRKIALSFDGAAELPHFHLTSFRVGKKIFATMDEANMRAMCKLTPVEQSVFTDGDAVYPVPGGWGVNGATYFDLTKVRKSVLKDALATAYKAIAPKSPKKKS